MLIGVYVSDDNVFDLIFKIVVQLEPLAVEKLYSVVFESVVGCGNDYPRVSVVVPHKIRHRRRRDYSRFYDVAAYSKDPCCKSVLKHIAGHSGVHTYKDHRLAVSLAEHVGSGFSKIECEFRCQFGVSDPPDAVRSK